mmetsp:Transcript_3183/g.3680  ORF Transcript_3183/g.3680 Transcript_3183/m.3680 type:complete len:97 (-) Transcript_3183:244-534(-)
MANKMMCVPFQVQGGGKIALSGIESPVYSIHRGAQHLSLMSADYKDCNFYHGNGVLNILPTCPTTHPLRRLGLPKKCIYSAAFGEFFLNMSAPIPL